MDMAAHDYYTVTHMVNVAVGCGLLARRLRPNAVEWQAALIEGGLLHDVGKRDIPPEVLNKEGRLSPQEWDLIRSHPGRGFEMLSANPSVHEVVLDMVRHHHERVDGGGYPCGLSADRLSEPARICAVIDAFDAVCSARAYRGPTAPEHTLKILAQGGGTQFDAEVVESWAEVVSGLLRVDPDRSFPAEPSVEPLPLEYFLQQSPTGAAEPAPGDRRRHPRFECRLRGKIRPRGPRTGLRDDDGEWIDALILDLSQSGARISVRIPLDRDQLVEIELPARGRAPLRRTARIIHVRTTPGPLWYAGLMFV